MSDIKLEIIKKISVLSKTDSGCFLRTQWFGIEAAAEPDDRCVPRGHRKGAGMISRGARRKPHAPEISSAQAWLQIQQ
jgi:hypothetical protein